MAKQIVIIAISVIAIITMTACSNNIIGDITDMEELEITNVKIYKNTPAWKLAQAVENENTIDIERIINEQPQVLNYQEPKYGATLLLWSIGMEKYESAEMLLKCGANPDIATILDGETPLFIASGFSWVDNEAKKDPKYVELLLSYGADPNKAYAGYRIPNRQSVIETATSPLMYSIGSGIEKTKALVEGGANIEHMSASRRTAAIMALIEDHNPEYAYFLIVEKKAKVTEAYYRRTVMSNQDPDEKFYPVNLLRYWVFDLDSKEYKMKMEIVEEFARQGVDYWETPIPKSTLEHIKKLFPDTWEDYIKKY